VDTVDAGMIGEKLFKTHSSNGKQIQCCFLVLYMRCSTCVLIFVLFACVVPTLYYLWFSICVVYLCCTCFIIVMYLCCNTCVVFPVLFYLCCRTSVIHLLDSPLLYSIYITNPHSCLRRMIKFTIKIRINFVSLYY
jgi:hypothetical protein